MLRERMHSLRCGRLPRFRRRAATIAPQTRTPQVRTARLCPAGRGKPARQTRATLRSGEAQRSRRRRGRRKHRHHAPPARRCARPAQKFSPLPPTGLERPRLRAHPPRRARSPGKQNAASAARQQAPRLSSVPRPRRAWLPDRLPKGPRGSPPRAARAPLP